MSDVPSGWYDDPEDPSGYRYWDGTQWTEHRSPKSLGGRGPSPSTSSDPLGELLSNTLQLLTSTWRGLAVTGAVMAAVTIVSLGLVAVLANDALDPGIFDIVSRVTEPGFSPQLDDSDQAFLDDITFEPGAGFWIVAITAGLTSLVVSYLGLAVATLHLASARAGATTSIGRCLRLAVSRVPRWIGISLLWFLGYLGMVLVAAFVFIALALIAGPLVLLPVLAVVPFFIWLYPTIWLMFTALLVGRRERPPFRTTLGLVRSGWGRAALPVLVINLIYFFGGLVLSAIGAIPVVGIVVYFAGSLVMYGFAISANIVLWTQLGGELDPELADPGVS
ncbi:MAG: DUF2510 domain-containing protein [Actinomycetota bacterium]